MPKGYHHPKTIKLVPLWTAFPSGRGIVEITYNAGYSSVPSDLVYAGCMIGVSLFNKQSHVGLKSEKAGGYSYSTDSSMGATIPRIAQRILSKHRRLFAQGMGSSE